MSEYLEGVAGGAMGEDPGNAYDRVPVPDGARLILATKNEHKVVELREILRASMPELPEDAVISAAELDVDDPVENGRTFAENALIKARAICAATGLPAAADDSGLCVAIMGGAPGIFSARWSGRHGDDDANNKLLLAQMADVEDHDRQASFICAAALVTPGGQEQVEEGEMRGFLRTSPAGDGGFGYDPLLQPEGQSRSVAQLSAQEKHAISHRGQAFRQLAPFIVAALEEQRH